MLRTWRLFPRTKHTLLRRFSDKKTLNSLDYCSNLVRQHDYENFLATLLMTQTIRSPAIVIRAFNVEIARVQDQTTDAQTAAFRFQFWKDAINTIYKKEQDIKYVPHNPIAQELFKVCNNYKLPKRYLERLVNSRQNILKSKHFKDLNEMEQYVDNTVSSIYLLILGAANIADVHADHAASHLGKAQGITNILRSIHVARHHKMIHLPMDILMKHQVSQETVLRGIDNENMKSVVFDIASRANSHLQKARSIKVPNAAHQIFLPAVAADKYLKNLQKFDFNVYDKRLQRSSVMLPIELYYKRLINKY